MTKTMTISPTRLYSIDTGAGACLTEGVSGREILAIAQAYADRLDEAVYVYAYGVATDDQPAQTRAVQPMEAKC